MLARWFHDIMTAWHHTHNSNTRIYSVTAHIRTSVFFNVDHYVGLSV